MSGQPSVLQVVILRDGLLVGTEMFVPGQYAIGSAPDADLRLDDASIALSHANIFFQNGRVVLQDPGSGGVFVNGHRINTCDVRPLDEISCGPFTLKIRVLEKKPTAKAGPTPEVAALLGQQQAAAPQAPVRSSPSGAPVAPPANPAARPQQPTAQNATVVSARRSGAVPAMQPPAPRAAPSAKPPANAFSDDEATMAMRAPPRPSSGSGLQSLASTADEAPTALNQAPMPSPVPQVTPQSQRRVAAAPAQAAPQQAARPQIARPAPGAPAATPLDADELAQIEADFVAAPTRAVPQPFIPAAAIPTPVPGALRIEKVPAAQAKAPAAPTAAPAPQARKEEPRAKPAEAAPAPAAAKQAPRAVQASNKVRRPTPSIPPATEGKGKPHLFVEGYWGEIRRWARSYQRIDPKKKLLAREDDASDLPLWGFGLQGAPFAFAEQKGDLYRVYVPPSAQVERRAQDGNFYPAATNDLEVGPGQRRCVTLGTGHALRFTNESGVTIIAYVQPAIPKPFVNPLSGLPWLALGLLGVFGALFGLFAFNAGLPESSDFKGAGLPPVAVRLVAPPKPEEKKELQKKVEKLKKDKPKPKEKEPPKAVAQPETKKVLKTVEKLMAAGPAMKDVLAKLDKLGGGPGVKNMKNDMKLSNLLGKNPIASAGTGLFGIGGGGAGGMGTKGAELLHGKGGGGIGALGTGNIGKGSVAGVVRQAASRSVDAQGSIDKEAVAKAINSHLAEVSSCYERALVKEPGLSGKIVLEWQITTSGTVGYAKTKSSSMKSAAVEACIINSLKGWRFPAAKGAGVIITYPFMFNSVGY